MEWIERVALGVELAGVVVIVVGGLGATIIFGRALLSAGDFQTAYHGYRANLGRGLLLGLEFLVAGDIIKTILVDQTLESVGVLAIVVAIRTFLSFSLETEIEGRPPWRSHRA